MRVTKTMSYWDKEANILRLLTPFLNESEEIFIKKYGPSNFVTFGGQNRMVGIHEKKFWLLRAKHLNFRMLGQGWLSIYVNTKRGLELTQKLDELLPNITIEVTLSNNVCLINESKEESK